MEKRISLKNWQFPFLAILLVIACGQITPNAEVVQSTHTRITEQTNDEREASFPTQIPAVKPTDRIAATPPIVMQTAVPVFTAEDFTPTPAVVPGAIARDHIEYITEVIGPRLAGSAAEAETAEYIQTALRDMGYTVVLQPFSRVGWVGEDEFETMIDSANVIATKTGDSAETIVVGAHYDSVGAALGADDNASGIGVLLELAETLYPIPTHYTLRFVAFGAEEVGPLGSVAYVLKLSSDERHNTVAMINLDSLITGDILYVYSVEGYGSVVRDWALDWATANGYDLQTIRNVDLSDEDGYPTADYAAFQDVGIPYAYFESTNWTLGHKDGYTQVDPQYGYHGAIIHTTYDRLDYLDATFPGRADERLSAVISIVRAILTQFEMPE